MEAGGVITRGALEVWPVVVPVVELVEAGVELLTAVRLLPHGPNSINAPAITTAAIMAVMVPAPIPELRLLTTIRSSGVRAFVVRVLTPAESRPG